MSDLVNIIADSVSPDGVRLTTATIRIHRFTLAEFNTHRQLSRNSSSSRAQPFNKVLDNIMKDIAIPYKFGTKKPGMQSGPALEGTELAEAEKIWVDAFHSAAEHATRLDELGVHKEVVNRLLEPFMWQHVLVSATSFKNFFDLRCSDLAQKEIEVPANALRDAMLDCEPMYLNYGEWHLPFVSDQEFRDWSTRECQEMSSARCARVSYLTHDGEVNYVKDFKLFDQLLNPADGQMHSSPFEHVATPAFKDGLGKYDNLGNFHGWTQLRHILEKEKYGV